MVRIDRGGLDFPALVVDCGARLLAIAWVFQSAWSIRGGGSFAFWELVSLSYFFCYCGIQVVKEDDENQRGGCSVSSLLCSLV